MATFTNQASLSYNNTITTSNVTTGELLEVLSITKSALSPSYGPNDNVTYVVSILNSGTVPFTGLSLTDDLGAYLLPDGTTQVVPLRYESGSILAYINGVAQPAPTVSAENPLTVTNLSIPAGGNLILIYEAEVTAYAPPTADGSIDNLATLSGGGLSTPVSSSATVNAQTAPLLAITKELSPLSVTENGTLTYTFTIQNLSNSPATAADNAVLSDQFDPILSGLTVTYNDAPWSTPANYSYNAATGEFQTLPGQITVPAASFTQDPATGLWTTTPGISVIRVVGTV